MRGRQTSKVRRSLAAGGGHEAAGLAAIRSVHLVSRISYLASRISHLVSCIVERQAAVAAYVAAGLNLAAGLVMALVLQPGLTGAGGWPQLNRMAYVMGHRAAWTAGWVVWRG